MTNRRRMMAAALGACVIIKASAAAAQAPPQGAPPFNPQGLFETRCLSCHGNASVDRAPSPTALRLMPPEQILSALTTGSMALQAQSLGDQQKRVLAEYIAGRNLRTPQSDATAMPNTCPANPPIRNLTTASSWNGWSADLANSRSQTASAAGLTAAQVPRLKLKWAFGLPGATSVYGQPAVVAGRVFVSSNAGDVYALDAATGCVHWSFQAQSAVRTAVSVGPVKGQGRTQYAAYFGDQRASVYAVDAATGRLLWKTRVDEHGLAGITGAPRLYNGRLYVPVSSREEPAGPSPAYPCCTFRGSVVALDASSGTQVWKTRIIGEEPKPVRMNAEGTQLYAPSGGAVWSTPTIDPARHALYIGTGNSTSRPAANTTDAIMGMDLDSGRVLWTAQDTPDDAWLVCFSPSENCPSPLGPDYDFGASPILRTLPDGRRVLVAGQKSGMVWGHDPDHKGRVMWKVQLPEQLALGEITFGGAADKESAYFGIRSGGIAAIRLATGEKRWFTPLAPAGGGGRGNTAALTLIPGVIFSGGWDGVLRALSTTDGALIWEFNTAQEFKTVNGVSAKGGAMGGPGPTIAGGTLFVGSGYTFGAGSPGNVLLAFTAE